MRVGAAAVAFTMGVGGVGYQAYVSARARMLLWRVGGGVDEDGFGGKAALAHSATSRRTWE